MRGHLDKRNIERSVWKISFKMADGSCFRQVISGNPEKVPRWKRQWTKSRRSPEIGERGLAQSRLAEAFYGIDGTNNEGDTIVWHSVDWCESVSSVLLSNCRRWWCDILSFHQQLLWLPKCKKQSKSVTNIFLIHLLISMNSSHWTARSNLYEVIRYIPII